MLELLTGMACGSATAIIASIIPGVGSIHAVLITLAIIGQGNSSSLPAALACWTVTTILMSSKEACFAALSGNPHAIAAMWNNVTSEPYEIGMTLGKFKFIAILIGLLIPFPKLALAPIASFLIIVAIYKLARGNHGTFLVTCGILVAVALMLKAMVSVGTVNPMLALSALIFYPSEDPHREMEQDATHEGTERESWAFGTCFALLSSFTPGVSVNLLTSSFQGLGLGRLLSTLIAQTIQEALTIRWALDGLSGGKTVVGQIVSAMDSWPSGLSPIALVVLAGLLALLGLPLMLNLHINLNHEQAAFIALLMHVGTALYLIPLKEPVTIVLTGAIVLAPLLGKLGIQRNVLSIVFSAPILLGELI